MLDNFHVQPARGPSSAFALGVWQRGQRASSLKNHVPQFVQGRPRSRALRIPPAPFPASPFPTLLFRTRFSTAAAAVVLPLSPCLRPSPNPSAYPCRNPDSHPLT